MTNTQNPAPTATNPVSDRRVQPARPDAGAVESRATSILDTTGEVLVQRATSGGPFAYTWSDLDPFTQGYVEALLRDFREGLDADIKQAMEMGGFSLAFSDLAHEALDLILDDCERFPFLFPDHPKTQFLGATFWRDRGEWCCPDFPPQTAYLSDNGNVCLREAA